MCDINTVESVLSADTLPTTQLFSTYLPATPPSYDLDTVYVGFAAYVQGLQTQKSLSDLENTLFLLSKRLLKYPEWREPSLKPLVTVHPFVVLASHRVALDTSLAAEAHIKRLIHREPLTAQRYLWTLQALDFLSDLAIIWQLILPAKFAHRSHLRGSIVTFQTAARLYEARHAMLITGSALCGCSAGNRVSRHCTGNAVQGSGERLCTLLGHFDRFESRSGFRKERTDKRLFVQVRESRT